MRIVLATSSPYRIEAFKTLGLEFEAESSNVDEKFSTRPNKPEELVLELAKRKAEAVAKNHADSLTIGFDTIAFFEGRILEKPKTKEEDFQRLKELSGKEFEFYTGIYTITPGKEPISRTSLTKATMRKLSEKEIKSYLESDEKFNTCALGFDTLGHYSNSFVKEITGSYNNIIRGIPLEEIVEILKEAGEIK